MVAPFRPLPRAQLSLPESASYLLKAEIGERSDEAPEANTTVEDRNPLALCLNGRKDRQNDD